MILGKSSSTLGKSSGKEVIYNASDADSCTNDLIKSTSDTNGYAKDVTPSAVDNIICTSDNIRSANDGISNVSDNIRSTSDGIFSARDNIYSAIDNINSTIFSRNSAILLCFLTIPLFLSKINPSFPSRACLPLGRGELKFTRRFLTRCVFYVNVLVALNT